MSLRGPIVLAYPVVMPHGLVTLAGDVRGVSLLALDDVAEGGASIYQEEIVSVDAVRSRYFLDTTSARRTSRDDERVIKSDAPYSGVVEHGWIERGRGQDSYPGRWPAARAVARFDPLIEAAFTTHFVSRFNLGA